MKKYLAVFLALSVLICSLSGCAFKLTTNDDDDDSSSSKTESNASNVEAPPDENNTASPGGKLLYVTGTSEQVALRESDEDTANVIAQLSLGEEVQLVSADSVTYYFVSCHPNGSQAEVKGYVKQAYLTDEKSAVCKNEECYTSKETSLYNSKESDHNEIQKLSAGTSVTVLAKTSGDYWFVNLTNSKTYGYVKCMEISTSKPAAASSQAPSSKAASSKAASSKAASAKQQQPSGDNRTIGSGPAPANYTVYYASVKSGYLAIRSAKAFNAANEIGKLYTGDSVYVVDTSTGTYWYCYAPSLGLYGYVNSDYLVYNYPYSTNTTGNTNQAPTNDYSVWTVRVASGYLALRKAPAYDASNELGKLYTGNVVYVYSTAYKNFSDVYWYVYSPSLDMWGYVNSNYIYSY